MKEFTLHLEIDEHSVSVTDCPKCGAINRLATFDIIGLTETGAGETHGNNPLLRMRTARQRGAMMLTQTHYEYGDRLMHIDAEYDVTDRLNSWNDTPN